MKTNSKLGEGPMSCNMPEIGINYSYITKTNWEEKMLYKNKIKVQNILKSAVA